MMLRKETFSFVPRLRAGLFCGLPPGEFCPLRIPFDRLRAAVSPRDKSRRDGALSPPPKGDGIFDTHFRKGFLPEPLGSPDGSRSARGGSLSEETKQARKGMGSSLYFRL
jgi:hypothetical protein